MNELVAVLVVAILGGLLSGIELVQRKGKSLLGWAGVAFAIAIVLIVT